MKDIQFIQEVLYFVNLSLAGTCLEPYRLFIPPPSCPSSNSLPTEELLAVANLSLNVCHNITCLGNTMVSF